MQWFINYKNYQNIFFPLQIAPALLVLGLSLDFPTFSSIELSLLFRWHFFALSVVVVFFLKRNSQCPPLLFFAKGQLSATPIEVPLWGCITCHLVPRSHTTSCKREKGGPYQMGYISAFCWVLKFSTQWSTWHQPHSCDMWETNMKSPQIIPWDGEWACVPRDAKKPRNSLVSTSVEQKPGINSVGSMLAEWTGWAGTWAVEDIQDLGVWPIAGS